MGLRSQERPRAECGELVNVQAEMSRQQPRELTGLELKYKLSWSQSTESHQYRSSTHKWDGVIQRNWDENRREPTCNPDNPMFKEEDSLKRLARES